MSTLNEGTESYKDASDDVSVDVLELSRSRDVVLEAKEDPDATENSSSFADTISGNENTSGLSDAEVESQFFGGSGVAPPFDGFGSIFPIRKRKMTAHWRSYVQPIMWRCKWTELKIKELESRALKYAREISLYDSTKHTAFNQITEEQKSSKMMSFTHHQNRRRSLMRRIKRKRVEDTTDLASYMSNHVLFSDRDSKRSDLDGVPTWDNNNLVTSDQTTTGQDEFGLYDENLFPEDDDDDDNFLEDTLRKIELVHARVHKLKSQLDVVMINNAGKFSSSENLSQLLGCDFQTSSARSPTYSACNGDTVSVGGIYQINNISDYELGDFVMNDSAVSSFGEAIPIPDIIESTVGLLSSIDVTQHQPQIGDSSEKIVDNIPIQNEAASEVEGSIFKYSHNQSAEKILEAENSGGEEESNNNNAVVSTLEPADVAAKGFATTDQSILKSCLSSEIHFPKNKRKRGERKAGSANWSRQRPGEPDS